MLGWAVFFSVGTVFTTLLGISGMAADAHGIVKTLALFFLLLSILAVISHALGRRG